jgi:thymidylate kinase
MVNDVLFIEFVGLPGAGKSTIASKVIQQFESENYGIYSREMLNRFRADKSKFHNGFNLLFFLISNLDFVIRCINYGRCFRPINFESMRFSYTAVRTAFKSKQAVEKAGKNGCRLVVFDQGILQDLWSVGVTGEPANLEILHEKLVRLLKPIYRQFAPVIVFIDTDAHRAAERIKLRGPSPYRFDNMEIKTVEKLLIAKENYMKSLVDTVSSIRSVKKFKIKNSCNLSDVEMEKLIEFIGRNTGK